MGQQLHYKKYNNYRGNRYQMDVINSRAYFLKSFNKHASHHPPNNQRSYHLESTSAKQQLTTNKLSNVVVLNLPNPKQRPPPTKPRKNYLISDQSLTLKEKDVLLKVVKGKILRQTQKRWKSFNEQRSMMFTKGKINEADSLQLKLNKPTDKIFHQLQNIRLAERLLFAKPSKDISNSSLTSFYQLHQQYKSNISRMPDYSLQLKSKRKPRAWPTRKNWLD